MLLTTNDALFWDSTAGSSTFAKALISDPVAKFTLKTSIRGQEKRYSHFWFPVFYIATTLSGFKQVQLLDYSIIFIT